MKAITLLLVAALAVSVQCASIYWTGFAQNDQWGTSLNWNTNTVPAAGDDVLIANGTVQVAQQAQVNSITIGTFADAPATVTVFQPFIVGSGGFNVANNGVLIVNSGTATIQGSLKVDGALQFLSGSLQGSVTVSASSTTNMVSGGQKVFNGGTFSTTGPVMMSGLVSLTNGASVTLNGVTTASGQMQLQGDNSGVTFSVASVSYNTADTFQIQCPISFGTFNLLQGNITIYNAVSFTNALNIPSTSGVSTLSTAVVNFAGGISGSGSFTALGASVAISTVSNFTGSVFLGAGNNQLGPNAVNIGGALTLLGGNATISGSGSIGTINFQGSLVSITGQITAGLINLDNGVINGAGSFTVTSLQISTKGVTLNAGISVTTAAMVNSASTLSFQTGGKLTINSGATLTAGSTITFSGPPGCPGVVNNGVIAATSAVTFQNINLQGTGSVQASAAVTLNLLTLQQGSVKLSGSGKFAGANTIITSLGSVSGGSTIAAKIGSYSFSCPTECDNIATSGRPTNAFSFAIGSSTKLKARRA